MTTRVPLALDHLTRARTHALDAESTVLEVTTHTVHSAAAFLHIYNWTLEQAAAGTAVTDEARAAELTRAGYLPPA